MKARRRVMWIAIAGGIVLAFVCCLPLRMSFKRELLGSVQVMSRESQFYIFAQTYESVWRPTLLDYLRTTLSGMGLIPPPVRQNEVLHVISGVGESEVRKQSHKIESAYGSAFGTKDSVYFSYGVQNPDLYPRVFEVTQSDLRLLPRAEALQLLSSFKNSTDETRAAGWVNEENYDSRGTREMPIGGTSYVLRVARERGRYDLELKSAGRDSVTFELHGKN